MRASIFIVAVFVALLILTVPCMAQESQDFRPRVIEVKLDSRAVKISEDRGAFSQHPVTSTTFLQWVDNVGPTSISAEEFEKALQDHLKAGRHVEKWDRENGDADIFVESHDRQHMIQMYLIRTAQKPETFEVSGVEVDHSVFLFNMLGNHSLEIKNEEGATLDVFLLETVSFTRVDRFDIVECLSARQFMRRLEEDIDKFGKGATFHQIGRFTSIEVADGRSRMPAVSYTITRDPLQ